MRVYPIRALLAPLILLVSCTQPVSEPVRNVRPATPPVRAETLPENTGLPLPEGGVLSLDTNQHLTELRSATVAGAKLTYLSFDTRSHTLEVIDQSSPGARYPNATAVTKATGALATINGGFFTPDGQPLGLLYHNGTQTGSMNSSSLGSGVLYVDKNLAKPILARRESFQEWIKDSAFDPKEVLQAGPFLIDNGRATKGLKNEEARIRSILLWDGSHHFALAQCEPITLKNLAGALAKQPLDGFRIHVALNLDGGRSADFDISSQVRGGPSNLRRWWNKPVRNFVVLKKL